MAGLPDVTRDAARNNTSGGEECRLHVNGQMPIVRAPIRKYNLLLAEGYWEEIIIIRIMVNFLTSCSHFLNISKFLHAMCPC